MYVCVVVVVRKILPCGCLASFGEIQQDSLLQTQLHRKSLWSVEDEMANSPQDAKLLDSNTSEDCCGYYDIAQLRPPP